mmetsp:Transcript_9404/g.8905  ORF Transcript_9404/g.8905 Transcript_9404/m.8905 type:complete len:87 (+) Transcript_9404:23-283(+)
MEVNWKRQYFKENTKENTGPILKDKNTWEPRSSNKGSLISVEGGGAGDMKLTSPNSKRSSLTEEGLTFGDVTVHSNENASQDISAL